MAWQNDERWKHYRIWLWCVGLTLQCALAHYVHTGFLPLAELPFLQFIGGAQFRKFCMITIFILVGTVAVTCYCHPEEERQQMAKTQK